MKIVLIGAYGYTGQIICQTLNQHKIEFFVAGRDQEKLRELQSTFDSVKAIQTIDLSRDNLDHFITSYDIFLNCAGPFTEESLQFVQAIAHHQKKIYFDITGEVNFVRQSHDQLHEIAQKNETLIVHSCAFESLLSDLISQKIQQELGDIQSIFTFYKLGHSRPSPGTWMTLKLNKFRENFKIEEGKWIPYPSNDKTALTNDNNWVGVPYPLPEIAFAKWNFNVQNAKTILLLPKEQALFIGASTAKQHGDIEQELSKLKQRKKAGPAIEERKNQAFEITVQATSSNGETKAYQLLSSDMYGLTAASQFQALQQILSRDTNIYGVQSPAMLFKGAEMSILQQMGVSVNESPLIASF